MTSFFNPDDLLPSMPTGSDLFQTPQIDFNPGALIDGVLDELTPSRLQQNHVPRAIVGSIVALGTKNPFFFLDTEVPEQLPLGGVQTHALHQFPGGARSMDTFGAQPHVLTFSGELYSVNARQYSFADPTTGVPRPYPETAQTALERSILLDSFRLTGNPVKFRFHYMEFTGIVVNYAATVHHDNHVSYTLEFKILYDNQHKPGLQTRAFAGARSQFTPPAESLLTQYVRYANQATQFINNAEVMINAGLSLLTQLQTDPGKVIWAGVAMIPGVQATTDLINSIISVHTAFDDYKNTHTQLILDMENAKPYDSLSSEAFTKYLIPETAKAANLLDEILKFWMNAKLTPFDPNISAVVNGPGYNAKSALGNMAKDMQRMVTPLQVPILRVQNPDLYQLAVYYYDDIEKWKLIADANGLTTPKPVGMFDLKIPADTSGGIPTDFGTVGLS